VISLPGPRRPLVVVLVVLGLLLSAVSVGAVWSRNQVLDTDAYLRSVQPLATDALIQDEVADKVATAISARLDSEALAASALPHRAAFLAVPLAEVVDDLVRDKSREFTHSLAFEQLWTELNRVSHRELVSILSGNTPPAIVVSGGQLILDLAPVVEAVRSRLIRAGLAVVAALPPIELVVEIADARGLEQARTAVRWLDRLAFWLPVAALLCLAGAVTASRRRTRSVLVISAGLLAVAVLLRIAIATGSHLAALHVPAEVASTDAVHAYYGHLTALLTRGAVSLGLCAAVVGLLVVVAPTAVRLFRSLVTHDLAPDAHVDARVDPLALRPALWLLALVGLLLVPRLDVGTFSLIMFLAGLASLTLTLVVARRRHVDPGSMHMELP
jgi:hypothetical protein